MEATLLTKEQVLGDKKLNIFKKIYSKCAVTDFAILLGDYASDEDYVDYDNTLKGRTGWYRLSTSDGDGDVRCLDEAGNVFAGFADRREIGIRPVIPLPPSLKEIKNKNEVDEVEYGEYPQYVVEPFLEAKLEQAYETGNLKKTGKIYTTDSRNWDDYTLPFHAVECEEYEYNSKKYIRIYYKNSNSCKLSNNIQYGIGNYVWLEISPLIWYLDIDANILVSKNIIASGVRFCDEGKYDGNFENTEMYSFLNNYFLKEINVNINYQKLTEEEKIIQEKINPYGFKFDEVGEEEIIKGCLESDIPVFLHGLSSEGKSARVKQIDPTCTIIYLRNETPVSINGKSVYNEKSNKMIDIKPSWLEKIEEKCSKEPDRIHVLFFDEISNALPSIQGMAFNIVLNKEVDGKWQLPANVRIVAAGNELKDSLAANQIAEPLFNRFAHVYIKTTTEKWLSWAIQNNIHPTIIAYITYTNGAALRSDYDGIKPNADPRKWEMASKMLYQTKNPEMLRCLVGEDITKEFTEFCKTPQITLEDVINDNYTDEQINNLNLANKYVLVSYLSKVNEENIEKVRSFVAKLGKELLNVFDLLWTRNDEERLEILQEIKIPKLILQKKEN